jgi:hypothetical protein
MHGRHLISFLFYSTFSPDTNHAETLLGWIGWTDSHRPGRAPAERRRMTQAISAATARRIALAAQGFADNRPAGEIARRHLAKVIGRIGLLQIDSVSVVVRAHYMPLFSRLGLYDRDLLDGAASGRKKRMLFEYWAHEASLLPVETWPLMRWRMDRAASNEGIYGRLAQFGRERADRVRHGVRQVGPVGVGPARVGWLDRLHQVVRVVGGRADTQPQDAEPGTGLGIQQQLLIANPAKPLTIRQDHN